MSVSGGRGFLGIFDLRLSCNSAAWYLQQGLAAAVPFIVFPWLLRTIGEAEVGIIIIMQTVVNYIILLADFGFSTTAVRFAALARGDRRELSRLAAAITGWRLGMALALGAAAGAAVTVFYPGSRWIFWACMLQAAGIALNPAWVFLALEKVFVFSGMMAAARLLPIAGIFLLVAGPEDGVPAALFLAAPFFLGSLPGWFYLAVREKIRPRFADLGHIGRLLSGGGRFYLGNLANAVYSLSPPLIVGALLGAEAAGVFGVMHRFFTTLANLFLPFYQAVYPRVCLAWEDSSREARRLLGRIHLLSLLLTVAVMAALLGLSARLTELLLGLPDPARGYTAVFRIMTALPLVMGQSAIWALLTLVAGGRHGRYLRAMAVTAAAAIPLGVGCTLAWGMPGAALAALLVEVLAAALLCRESRLAFPAGARA